MRKYKATNRFYAIIGVLFIIFSYFMLRGTQWSDLVTSVYWR